MPVTVCRPGWAKNPATMARKVANVGAVKQGRNTMSRSASERGRLGMSIGGCSFSGEWAADARLLGCTRQAGQLSQPSPPKSRNTRYRTNRAYSREVTELKVELSETLAPPKPRHEVVVLVEGLNRAAFAAVQSARQLRSQRAVAVHVAVDAQAACGLQALWAKLQIPLPLEVVPSDGRELGATVARVVAGRARPDTEVTVLLPRRAYAGLLDRLRRGRRTDALLGALGGMEGVHVTAVPRVAPRDQRRHRLLRVAGNGDGQAATALDELVAEAAPALASPKPRHEVVVLVEGLDRASLGALQYATELHPLSITAVHVAVDPDAARRLAQLWAKVRIPIPLEVIDCPDRNLLA